ncbi:RNA polymerase sigma factor [Pseudoxanthomonas mexicana]|uniref:RNA polymerase sigma factor n=1 Tax=Pseudoxanthomonas mexicana TaxID=128785 RepID=UPI00398A932E
MDDTESTAALVVAARAGAGAAMARLYRRFAPVVHGILLSYVAPADADDLTQDAFETAMQRLPALHDPAAFPGWIASIARRMALDAKRRRPPLAEAEIERLPDTADVEARFDAERALRAIRGLPAAYRETLLLRLAEGLTGPEIAARTGLSAGSVRVNLHRGMALLRAALAVTARGDGT